jgi:hypothetical protein
MLNGIRTILTKQNIFIGTTKRCSHCHSTNYCGEKCQKLHWQSGHKSECFDSALIEELKNVSEDEPLYDDLATREFRLFRTLTGVENYEALAFMFLFPLGKGYFDQPRESPIRFAEYRQYLLRHASGRFAASQGWSSWAKDMEKKLGRELAKEISKERRSNEV